MKVGDLVICRQDGEKMVGLILEEIIKLEIGLNAFKVLTSDGNIGGYTTASMRSIDESW